VSLEQTDAELEHLLAVDISQLSADERRQHNDQMARLCLLRAAMRYNQEPTLVEQVCRLYDKATPEERAAIVRHITGGGKK
jgi:hypothetical protein